MKKLLAILTCVLLLCASIPLGALSVAAATTGTTGDCQWRLDGTTLTIYGNGAMESFYTPTYASWKSTITKVVIEEGVTTIGYCAFNYFPALTSVSIPNSVTVIGGASLAGCSQLRSVTIPSGVTTIEFGAFANNGLRTVTLSNSVTTIQSAAFNNSVYLTDVYYGGRVEDRAAMSIDDYNNPLLNALWHYNYAPAHTHVYDNACDTSCNVCSAIRQVGDHVYDSACDDRCVECNKYRTPPHYYAGDCDLYCSRCGEKRYPSAAHTYDNDHDDTCNACGQRRDQVDHAYDNDCDSDCNGCGEVREAPHAYDDACDTDCNACGLLREAPHSYDSACDTDCSLCGLVRDVSDHVYSYACDDDCNACGFVRDVPEHVYDDADSPCCEVCGMMRPDESESENIIASSDDYNFRWTLNDEGVLLVKSSDVPEYTASKYLYSYRHLIKEIEFYYSYTDIGAYAFADCTELVSVNFNAIDSIGAYAFSNCTALTSAFLVDVDVDDYAFSGCTSLDTVTFVPDYGSCSLQNVVFGGCTALRSIYIYNTSTFMAEIYQHNTIGVSSQSDSFYGVTATLYYPPFKRASDWLKRADAGEYGGDLSIAPSWSAPVGPDAFAYYNEATQTLTIRGTGSLLDVASGTNTWWSDYAHRKQIKHIVFEDGITAIPSYAFEYYFFLESVRLPNTLTMLECNAFNDCERLTSLVIPASVNIVGQSFHRCDSLTDIHYMGTDEDWKNVTVTDYYAPCDVTYYGKTLHYLQYVPEEKNCGAEGKAAYYIFDDGSGLFDENKNPITAVSTVPTTDHTYDNICDYDCNVCGLWREAPHRFSGDCDEYCDMCGAWRYPDISHTYDYECDPMCDVCGQMRYYAECVYDDECDADCNYCGALREPPHYCYSDCDEYCILCGAWREAPHYFVSDCDEYCSECGWCRPTDTDHTYDNNCDEYCNVCDYGWREPLHDRDGECDEYCNTCGAECWTYASHYYDDEEVDYLNGDCDPDCDVCGAWREPPHYFSDECDEYCDVCVEWREAPHVYGGDCDAYCNMCDNWREIYTDHVYDDDWDEWCNVCDEWREVYYPCGHDYDHECDEYCNVCGEWREVPHYFDSDCDAYCNYCDKWRSTYYDHSYDIYDPYGDCDPDCDVCGERRDPPHAFGSDCDAYCDQCGEWRETYVSHVYDNACDTDCNACYEQREVPAHTYESTITTAPTCGAEGEMTYTCSACGDTYTESIPATENHRYASKVTIYPTCGDPGLMTYTCSGCSHRYTEFIVATGFHTYDNACDTDCNVCGEMRQVSAHVYDNACDTDCNVCGEMRQVPAHTYESTVTTAPTCGAEGEMTYTCSACGDTYTESIPATENHRYASKVTIYPTCGDPGLMTYTCSGCGHRYTEFIVATGFHTYDNACDTDCNVCGEMRWVPAHTYESTVTTAPTCGTKGVRTYTCTACGDAYTEVLPPIGDHVYDNGFDADCNVCGTVREVDIPADAPTFVVEDATVRAGDTFTVAIRTLNNSGIVSLKLKVAYDADVLELISTAQGDFAEPTFGPIVKNPFTVNWLETLLPNNTTDGAVAFLTFRVKEGATVGETAITITYDPEDVYDSNFDNVSFLVENGTVNVVDFLYGDTNGDGNVNNKDLGLLQRYINEWDVTLDPSAADVDGNGKVNNLDLGLLQRYLSDWDVELG